MPSALSSDVYSLDQEETALLYLIEYSLCRNKEKMDVLGVSSRTMNNEAKEFKGKIGSSLYLCVY